MNRLALFGLRAVLAGTVLCLAPHASAQQAERTPVLLSADSMVHDEATNRVTAEGHVEISQNERTLLADKITYDINADRIIASGNVALVETTGDVFFADEIEVTGDLKNGIAHDIRVLLTDQSRLAAAVGRRTDGTVTELERAVYSACQPCKDKPDRPLLWQVKAQHVIHDQQTHDIEYRNAWLEMFGVPVVYTPWFSHPDPTVKRRSGFLPPSFSKSSNVGYTATIPYYYEISPHQDLTVAPKFTSKEGPVLAGEHRQRFTFGEMRTDASITHDSDGDIRGHLFAEGRFDINETWRTGYDIRRTSDAAYLRRYDFTTTTRPYLTSRAWTEGFFGQRSYGLVEAYAFQDQLGTVNEGTLPVVAPMLQYNYVGTPGAYGGRWNLDANLISLIRTDGQDTQRLAVRPSWVLPYTAPAGDIYTLTFAAQADAAHAGDLADGSDVTTGRFLPEVSLEWRYPFISTVYGFTQTIEPIVMGVLSPQWDTDDLPNEDSLDVEFSETNLFRSSRFAGFDRRDSGPRISYGVKYDFYGEKWGHIGTLIGQSYRVSHEDSAPALTGFDEPFSDIVGRIVVSPSDYLDLYYRFRLDKDDLSPRRNEFIVAGGLPFLRAAIDYTSVDASASTGELTDRREAAFSLSASISRNWSAGAYVRRDLEQNELVHQGISVMYDDECFSLGLSWQQTGTRSTDVDPGSSVLLKFVFKTLGEAPITIN